MVALMRPLRCGAQSPSGGAQLEAQLTQVLWSEDAERLLFTLPAFDAERILDAVTTLAEARKGFVRCMLERPEVRLYIPGYAITFELDAGVMFVLRIRASGRHGASP